MKTLPKAVSREGKIGAGSCYVLDDGRCVLSKNTVFQALAGSTGFGNLDKYLDRLASRVGHLSARPVFEFTLPGGGTAEAVDDESFAAIVEAYVDGLISGKLHTQQIPIAQRAHELQKTWARVGLRAHILAATGTAPEAAVRRVQSYAERLLARDPREWDRRFSSEFVEAVCSVYGWSMQGRRTPHQMAAVFDKLYRLMLGPEAKAALKARNPEPRFGSNHHQHLAEELDRELPTLTRAIIYIAHRSGRDVPYFWRQVAELLGLNAVQVDLPLPA
jgi:hypothetical protein